MINADLELKYNKLMISSDFRVHMDPVYGNCYTYNWKHDVEKTSERAGPMYGFRLLAFTNISEYLKTTEASGIRMQVHQQSSFPFPDTFGYNAPTGMISSFGIKLVRISSQILIEKNFNEFGRKLFIVCRSLTANA